MSIINEAIKKARKEFEVKNTCATPGITKLERPIITESSQLKWTASVTVSLVIVISLLGSVILYRHMSRLHIVETPSINTVETKIALHPIAPSSNTNHKPLVPRSNMKDILHLNGILSDPGDKWAIINGRIMREGDIILDGRLIQIEKNFVRIEKDEGEEIVLNLQ